MRFIARVQYVFLLLLLFLSGMAVAQVNLDHSWKFKTGDDPAYAQPGFDDSAWSPINITQTWEEQGRTGYDGYAWYRLHFRIPAGMLESSGLKNAILLQLGRIDDVDETFLNGRKIGQLGRFPEEPGGYQNAWDVPRRYRAVFEPNDLPLWPDADNVLAVRVYDGGGAGGMFGGGSLSLSMAEVTDFLELHSETEIREGTAGITFTLKNSLNRAVDGQVHLQPDGDKSKKPTPAQAVRIEPGGVRTFSMEQAIAKHQYVRFKFTEKESGKTLEAGAELPYILTPPESPKPRVNNAAAFGLRPGAPCLYRVAATGQRPMRFTARGLPKGLRIDERTGIISGTTAGRGIFNVTLEAANSLGSAQKLVNFVIGDNICLTPPLGWNSWNCWGLSVSDERVRASADAMISSGLADHGWSYMNIDDGWEAAERDPETGEIRCNEKFPDMKGLADYLHGRGLKIGIYSSPGTRTCGGFLGSWQHEAQDAQSWAQWGIDYLKYDWCSYGQIAPQKPELPDLKKPYEVMRAALDRTGRDIVYSLCQYGMGDVWKWGGEVGGNLWRTTGDITDTWESLSSIGFNQADPAPYARPGHWNDPDMLIVGRVGWGDHLHPTRLTPSEQYTHLSLWALLSAPLLIGCDLASMDPFTYNLLANDEVLAVNQDIMGKAARRVLNRDDLQVWVKELDGGGRAVGVFNLSGTEKTVSLDWSELGLSGFAGVRDLWRQQDVGRFGKKLRAEVYGHGVALLRLDP